MDNEQDNIESQNDEQIDDIDTQDDESQDSDELATKLEEANKKIATLEAQKIHWKKKATEKSESPDDTQKSSGDELSSRDLLAVINHKVNEEDLPEVIKDSKILGKTVAESLKDPVVQEILKRNEEVRTSANATTIKNGRPGIKKPSPEEIMKQASSGNIPKPGSSEAEELFWARRGGKK